MGQLHPIVWRYNMGRMPSYRRVAYAFHDITDDGYPELIIGAVGNRHSNYYIIGIYKLVEGVPVSVIQYCGGRELLSLLIDVNGNTVVEHSWGHGGSSEQLFYAVDENGGLLLLDAIFTFDFDRELWKLGDRTRPRIRYLEGVDAWLAESEYITHLTEMEYVALMFKYGSKGYESFDIISEEEFINWMRMYHPCKYEQYQGFGIIRRANLEWKYVVPLAYSSE